MFQGLNPVGQAPQNNQKISFKFLPRTQTNNGSQKRKSEDVNLQVLQSTGNLQVQTNHPLKKFKSEETIYSEDSFDIFATPNQELPPFNPVGSLVEDVFQRNDRHTNDGLDIDNSVQTNDTITPRKDDEVIYTCERRTLNRSQIDDEPLGESEMDDLYDGLVQATKGSITSRETQLRIKTILNDNPGDLEHPIDTLRLLLKFAEMTNESGRRVLDPSDVSNYLTRLAGNQSTGAMFELVAAKSFYDDGYDITRLCRVVIPRHDCQTTSYRERTEVDFEVEDYCYQVKHFNSLSKNNINDTIDQLIATKDFTGKGVRLILNHDCLGEDGVTLGKGGGVPQKLQKALVELGAKLTLIQ